ncbi:response regulator [Planctomycetota bacterium]
MAHILVIDDNTNLREMVCSILMRAGHYVLEACDGSEAIDMITEKTPDLIITDIIMPGKEGIQTIIDLRRSHPDLRIIGMSGGGTIGSEHCLDMAKEFGASQTLQKPFGKEKLLKTVNQVLANVDNRAYCSITENSS